MPLSRRAALLAAALVAFGGCDAAFGPRTIVVSEVQLQEAIAKRFPLHNRWLELLDVTIDTPRVHLRSDTHRIALELDLHTSDRLLKTPRTGTLVLACGVRFEAADNTLRLADVHVERLEIEPAGGGLQRELQRLGAPLAEQWLEGRVIHALRPKDIDLLRSHGLKPGEISVTPAGLQLALVPA